MPWHEGASSGAQCDGEVAWRCEQHCVEAVGSREELGQRMIGVAY
jgi:hypothetical protein